MRFKVAWGTPLACLIMGCAAAPSTSEPANSEPAASGPAEIATTTASVGDQIPCAAPLRQTTEFKWTVDGAERSALVHPSNSGEAVPAPIVVALHGYGGSGFELELISKLSDAADERGWFVVYPEGTGVPQAWSEDRHASDLAFLRQLVEDLVKGGCGDPARVIVTGISQGGWLSDMAGCEMSDIVAGVVAVAGRDMGWPCTPTRPVAFAAINGVLDEVLPFAGGSVNVAARVTEVQSVEAWAAQRAQLRSCQGQPSTTRQSPNVVAYVWSGCLAPMWLYRVEDGGHSWPGGSGIAHVDKELLVTDVIAAMLQAVS